MTDHMNLNGPDSPFGSMAWAERVRAAEAARDRHEVRGTFLTPDEHEIITKAGDLWNLICAAVPSGPTRASDLDELAFHVHAIQHAVMANAAARAYPDLYRRLGDVLASTPAPDDHEEVAP